MRQYLVTRFNIPITYGSMKSSLKGIDFATDRDYLNYRFELFERYTFPSIKNQTVQDFKWIVMFHEKTPDEFKARIEGYSKIMPQFIPLYISESDNEKNIIYIKLKERILEDDSDKYIITRIDNDDAIHKSYLETMRKYSGEIPDKKIPYVINYESGLIYLTKTKYTRRAEVKKNHYITLVSDKNSLATPLEINHTLCDKYYETINYKDHQKPLWLEIDHGKNVSNQVTVNIFKSQSDPSVFKDFNVPISWTGIEYLKTVAVSLIPTYRAAFTLFMMKLKRVL